MTNHDWSKLRIINTDWLNAYTRRRFPSIGRLFAEPYVIHHSWLPGIIPATALEMLTAARAIKGMECADSELLDALTSRLDPIGWLVESEIGLRQLVGKTAMFPAFQNCHEMLEFLQSVQRQQPKVIVEIGTAAGGMLYCLAQIAPPNALLVSIDVGKEGSFGGGPTETDCQMYQHFKGEKQQIECIQGNSASWETRENLKSLLDGQAIDLLFIDGDHHYGAVKTDYEMYAGLVSTEGTIALHDICTKPTTHGEGMEVGLAWPELAAHHESREIISGGANSFDELAANILRHIPAAAGLLHLGLEVQEVAALIGQSPLVWPQSTSLQLPTSLFAVPTSAQPRFGIGLLQGGHRGKLTP